MVTLQILVLSFLVRIQVAQLKRSSLKVVFLCFLGGIFASGSGTHYVCIYYGISDASI